MLKKVLLCSLLAGSAHARGVDPRGELGPEERATIALFKDAERTVVYITTTQVQRSPFSFDTAEVPAGTGSGFVWDTEGHVVTNFHVIQGANGAEVTLDNQTHWPAELVGTAQDKDIAVLRIQAPKAQLKAISIGTSAELAVGQHVFAIGNPFGLDQTLTTGIISALGREIKSVTGRPITGVIQTDATINPGNSGGPLLDSAGRLIGMNTAIYSPTGASVGIGFAVPVDTVNRIVEKLIKYGKVSRPTLGIHPAEDHVTRRLGKKGVLILDVLPRTGAAESGLRPTRRDNRGRVSLGDIIVAVDAKKVNDSNDLYKAIDEKEPGDTVQVTVERNGNKETVPVKLSRD